MNFVAHPHSLSQDNVPIHVISMVTVSMGGVTAFWGSMAMIVVNASVLLIAASMANALTMESVNVRMATLVLTAPQLPVTSNAVFMEGSVTMASVSSVAQTMLVTHVKTAPC